MDTRNPTRFCPSRKAPPAERFLGVLPPGQPETPATYSAEADLTEDDIFNAGDDFSQPNSHHNSHPSAPPSSSSTSRRRNRSFGGPESFGILAALPENHTQLLRRAVSLSSSSSSCSSSSARAVPLIPKPPPERERMFLCSAPVNVPVWAAKPRAWYAAVEDDGGDGGTEDGGEEREMVPPHELAARQETEMMTCSVLEGVGRTLKGRDLRQVRNAIWRKTGFLD